MSRLPLSTCLGRGVRLRCPRCGEGKLFRSFLSMHENCETCGLKYERAPGYFLGSAYINYAATAILITTAYVVLHFVLKFSNDQLIVPLVAFVVLFPILFFRWARSLWLAADCFFDATGMQEEQ